MTTVQRSLCGFLFCIFLPLTGCGWATTTSHTAPHTITLQEAYTDIVYYKATARMEIRNVTLGFMPDPERPLAGDPAVNGNQFARVEIAFTNTGVEPFSMRYTNISLTHSAKKEDGQTFLIRDNNVDDLLKGAEIAAGEEVVGAMYFEIPMQDTSSDLILHYNGYDGQSTQYSVALQ